ncbi:hypothetical protein ACR8AL_03055 [Clavibacter sepedonicus]|uniref:Uncharacterized protein n=1 Tax=Clavibacter sepedonicus TaxID=31964 RepID=B0RDM1_CLASE|nr:MULTISPECIES: hypothetical protein [Clavibacter]MBD5382547.1 hypothetical protein [Clavibacter sp.]OQJ48573.1 hypothetical protein B5P19_10140 [Clavibacter sepedonicus]OQJ54118.1 hypothetical protein B5P20_08325 [Clavibacter sepedonicus]UUK65653.1 hypothetical protein LRE50_15550 [Clavibacter sepedonicus]CAQ03150.1 hypothetical protein CMS3082 [Clavibacter sepedonicus]
MTAAVAGLTVTEGGGTAVETDDLTRIAARLDDAGGRLDDHARALALPPLVASITGDHDAALDAPRGLLASAAHDARALAADLRRVAAQYVDGERDVDRCVRSASGEGATDAARALLGGIGGEPDPLRLGGLRLLGVGSMLALHPDGPGRIVLPGVLRDVVSDIAASATRFLPGRPAGDDGVRETTAGLLAALGAVGLLRDAPATVRVRRDALRSAPATLGDLSERIPDPVPGAPQMRVEEYRAPDGRRRFVAYLGGMVTLDPRTGREDFGPASAVAALATEGGSAVHAAETALRDAGATADDEVYVIGYSMGGILARSVGDAPGFHVTHELTFGSPVGQLPIREGIDGVAVEHTDDPVPALGGARTSEGDAGDDVVVRTPAFAPTAQAGPLGAHELDTYRETAAEMDASRSPLLERARDELHGFLDGATPVASHLYRAERGPIRPSGAPGGGM